MTEQHILNELYKAQADLEKAQSLVHQYQDVIRAAERLVNAIDYRSNRPPSSYMTSGGQYGWALHDLRQALWSVLNPNGDAAEPIEYLDEIKSEKQHRL